ncbi:hypothetical protein FRB94_010512 [Tulasnella sp. JGI-2019a]|nr:hypothetical protein FRB94_010512 [Tulasnella sp. JGI-2019a]
MSSSVSSTPIFSVPSSSSSAHTTPPKLPLRSALRSKASTSTITAETTQEKRPMAAAVALHSLAPPLPPPPSPKQSYFDKYPVRGQKSKELLAEATSSSRAQTARERARALSAHYDSVGSESEPSSQSQQSQVETTALSPKEKHEGRVFPASYAFPSLDDSMDDAPRASTSSFTPKAPSKRHPRDRQLSTTSSKGRRAPSSRSKSKAFGNHSPERVPTPPTIAPSRDAYPLSPISSDPPFFSRTSMSSSSRSRTQTTSTFADPDHDNDHEADSTFTLPTPVSSIYKYRADGVSVMVAAPTSNNGVETMDALVNQMNGGIQEDDIFSSILNTGRRMSVAPIKEKDKRRSASVNTTFGKTRHHPLYHPPLPDPPKGVTLGMSPNRWDRKSDETTDSEMSTVEKERTKRWTAKQQQPPPPPRLPSYDSTHSESATRPTSSHRSHSDGTVKSTANTQRGGGSSTTDIGGESSSTHHHHPYYPHHRKKGSGTSFSRPNSRDKTSHRPNSRDKTSSRPGSADKDLNGDLRRGSRLRAERPHKFARPKYDGDSDLRSDSASASASASTSVTPSPVVQQLPPIPVVVPTIDEIIRKNAPALVTWASSPRRNNDSQASSPSEPSASPVVPFPSSPAMLAQQQQHPGSRQRRTARLAPPPSSYVPASSATVSPVVEGRSNTTTEDEDDETALSSADSIAAEVRRSLKKKVTHPSPPHPGVLKRTSEDSTASFGKRSLQHARSFGADPTRAGTPDTIGAPGSEGYPHAARRPFCARMPKSEGGGPGVPGSSWSGPAMSVAPSTPDSNGMYPASLAHSNGQSTPGIGAGGFGLQQQQSGQDSVKHELAQFLRSPRLTRLFTLRRHPHAGLTVSMADVGSPTGHPVIVYLGLGCVRYLIALYDEMAEALNLRLVCVDRWGLGRTGEPKDASGRGLLEWASVIEEVADELGLERFSVVAHSAGAPYALAGVCKWGSRRVVGRVCLLAPWVSMSVDGGYKWLKYVPNGIIKTAQAAEWKVQGWMLGKPPTITYPAIGYDATTGTTTHDGSYSKSPAVPAKELNQQSTAAKTLAPTATPLSVVIETRSSGSVSTSEYDDLADFKGKFGSNTTLALPNGTSEATVPKSKKKGKKMLSLFNTGAPPVAASGVNDPTSARTSRTNSVSSNAATLPAKSPKLKGLKSLSSLRNEAANMPLPQEAIRRTSEPTAPSQLSKVNELTSSMVAESDASCGGGDGVALPAHVGLGIGLDEEMLQWSSRLQMLEELEQPATTATSAPAPAPAGPRFQEPNPPRLSTTTSRSSTEGRRTFARAFSAGSPLIIPPVPPLPSLPSPNPSDPIMSPMSGNSGTRPGSAPRNKSGMSLTNALLRASHAESLKGGTADLLAILERDSKPWGFSYADVKQRVKVWYGDRDEKIAIGSVHWMERVMKDCTVQIVKGGTHNLMTNADVVVEVLESIAKDWAALPLTGRGGGGESMSPGGMGSFSPSHGPSGSISSFSRRRGRV